MGNIITVNMNYGCCRTEQYITDQKLYQYDYGQILKLTGIDLPAVYEVHFSNGERGTSTTGIGTADGVEIPDQYLLNAGKLYVWLYTHTTEDDGETELGFWIPIIPRAQPTHETPTPVQQTEIERLIALAEEIVEHGGGGGGSGEDGFSPIVTVTEITGGHRISIQDKTHTATFDVMDGTDGTDGDDGDDGVSPAVTITEITNGHRVTITDKDHPSGMSFDVLNGTNGTNGVSPVVSVSAITGGNAVTITDATHPQGQTFNVMNGQDGQDGSDYVLTAQDKSDIADLVNVSTPRIVKTSSDTTAELEPNKFYVFPEMSALTITLATPSDATIANEYHFMFTSGATATTLTIPSTVSEPSGFTVEANTTYEVSIMENCMLANSWAVSS